MAIECPHPHCRKSVPKDANGGYPARCPHCGLLLKLPEKKSKPTSTTQSAAAPNSPPKIVASSKSDPGKVNSAKTDPNKMVARPAEVKSDPAKNPALAKDSAEKKIVRKPDPVGVGAKPVLPKGIPLSAKPKSDLPAEFQTDGDSPFGITIASPVATPVTSRYLQTASKRQTSAIVALVVLIAAGVGITLYFRTNTPPKPEAKQTAPGIVFNVPDRNYTFSPPSERWQKIERDGFEISFLDSTSGAELSLKSEFAQEAAYDKIAKEAVNHWSKNVVDVKELPTESTTLDGQSALKTVAEGKRNKLTVRLEALVLFYEGITYQLALSGPTDKIGTGEADLTTVSKGFHLLGKRANWKQASAPKVDTFVSDKHPYQLKAPARHWKRLKEPDPGNRLADLRLADTKKDGLISVTPRQVPEISDVQDAYVARQKKTFKSAQVTFSDDNAKVAGNEAHQIKIKAEDPETGTFLFQVVFVKAEPFVYVIECRCSADKAAEYEPAFMQIIQSMELIPEAEWAATKAKSTDSAKMATDSKSEDKAPKKEKPVDDKPVKESAKTPKSEKKMESTEKKPVPPKVDAEKKSEADKQATKSNDKDAAKKEKKTRSLDDLDFDGPSKKDSKQKGEKKEPQAPNAE